MTHSLERWHDVRHGHSGSWTQGIVQSVLAAREIGLKAADGLLAILQDEIEVGFEAVLRLAQPLARLREISSQLRTFQLSNAVADPA